MKEFAKQIYSAARTGKLRQPFNAEMVRAVCPGWADYTYRTFLAKHAKGNPGQNTELFIRVARGLYEIKG
ncbi:hypothetical protein ACJ4V0_04885 [Phreatobacter sp. HK31-P]